MANEIPKHVAIIMDGNGRWAKNQGLPRIKGHEVGAQRAEEIIEEAQRMGIRYLTLYAFSKENWQRPKPEIDFLMGLLLNYLDSRFDKLIKNNVVLNVIGETADLPGPVQRQLAKSMEASKKNTGLTVNMALSYSSRFEIVRACQRIAEKVRNGGLDPAAISEETVAADLYTAGMPDPELLIRTSGEMRVSNFLLWQISYTELYVTPKQWPEFTREEFHKAIADYQQRERRFGRTVAVSGGNHESIG